MFTQDIKGATAQATALKSQSLTSGATLGAAIDLRTYRGKVMLILNAAAATAGSSPTLNVKVTNSDTSGGSYTDVSGATFTQVTDAADSLQALGLDPDECKPFIKISATVGGSSSPAFPAGVVLVGIPQRLS